MLKSVLLLSCYLFTISALTVNSTSSLKLVEPVCLPRAAGRIPLIFRECVAALGLIVREAQHQSDEPQTWSHSASDPLVVRRWTSQACTVVLLAKEEHIPAEDEFSLRSIALSAAAITYQCVLSADHIGGTVDIGPREVFKVAVVRNGFVTTDQAF